MAHNSPPKSTTSPATRDASVEYRLSRNAVVEGYKSGRLSRTDVCDAHPELLRASRNKIGLPTQEICPICNEAETVQVTYVFGAKLPANGTCPSTKTELNRLKRREEPVTCYDVEVCPACAWHHLIRKYPAGGKMPKVKRTGSQ